MDFYFILVTFKIWAIPGLFLFIQTTKKKIMQKRPFNIKFWD